MSEESVVKEVTINKSAYFLLPLLGLDLKHPDFINTYLAVDDNGLSGMDGSLFLELSAEDDSLLMHPNLIKYFYTDYSYFYQFELSKRFQEDYNKFVQGKYSQFSKDAIRIICERRSINLRKDIEDTDLYKIFTKSTDRIKYIEHLVGEKLPEDAELLSIININDEIYEK